MNLKIEDVCYIVFAAVCLFLLIKEFIPDHVKKYWSYIRQNDKDHKKGWFNRKWIFTFKR